MARPNILFLFSDEHSFRCLGHVPEAAGGESVDTPNLDRLAATGTAFSNAYCQMPLCTPSRLCVLTGREVRGAGAWNNCSVLRPELPTVAGVLGDAGYATCLVGKMHLGGSQQFAGFQYRPYGDLTGGTGHQWEPLAAPERHSMRARTTCVGQTEIPESLIQDQVVAHESVAFLREQSAREPDQPWFLCASFSRPHFPLTAPQRHLDCYPPERVSEPRYATGGAAWDHPMSVGMRTGFMADAIDHDEMMRARAAYLAGVSYLDEVIGDLLTRLEVSGLLANTVIIYSTDHGELAGEHGVWWKHAWFEGCARVPLIVSIPAQRRGDAAPRQCDTPVGLVDLFPTCCGLAGVEPPVGLDGRDLGGAIAGDTLADRPVFCDNLVPRWGAGTEFRMIRWKGCKCVVFRDAPPLFFDLIQDPGEQHNLVDAEVGPELATIRDELARLAAETMDFEEAETERTIRDGGLLAQYPQDLPPSTGNLYLMPSGKLVNAEDALYHPTVVAATPAEAFSGQAMPGAAKNGGQQ